MCFLILKMLTLNDMNILSFCKNVFLLCSVTLLLHACKKHHEVDTNEYLLSRVDINGWHSSDYYYNDSGQLIKSINWQPKSPSAFVELWHEYNYNDQKQITQVINTPYYTGYGTKNEYTYNSDGKLVLIQTYHSITNALLNTYKYSYTDHTITETYAENGVTLYVYTFTIDDKGNFVKAVRDDQTATNNDWVEEWLDYDEKPNIAGPSIGNISAKNNPRRHTAVFPGGGLVTDYYKYNYNNAGYVTERKVYQTGGSIMNVYKYTLIPK
jgi:hypothetical protein